MMIRLLVAIDLVVCLLLVHPDAISAEVQREVIGAVEPTTPAEAYGLGVRDTDWRTPQDEMAGFHLPPNFEVRMFASEPQIAKPLNLSFDARGRMWVTQSLEYPYAAQGGATPRDSVKILEDTDADGTADRITTFADQLNIPMGIIPYGDGCICFSIPNLLYLRDTDGDGRCDKREVILGPFDTTRDTHGMINALRDGGDGWIYACHGFNNQSRVAGRDGHAVTMHSGNTFRFRPDGSRIELVTSGQVNPFGMTEDQWGYRYSADCHSKPITQLIHGACYPSFGRPHDGLGFLPPMVDHLHGSTAISGIVYYPMKHSVTPLQGQMISGNVMTSRLNRNRVIYHGATARGVELADFMTSDDPWFRPVDLRRGPDGHLYVADFYNRIIGHYEVPLDHPDRDRKSGRIWQIRYRGAGDSPNRPNNTNLADTPPQSSGQDRKSMLFDPGIVEGRRMLELRRQFQTGTLDADSLFQCLKADSEPLRVAAMRLAGELVNLETFDSSKVVQAARLGLADDNAHFAQASSELLGRHGNGDDIPLMLHHLDLVPESDPVLRQTLRLAIRQRLREVPPDHAVWSSEVDSHLASILLGLERPEVSPMLLAYLANHSGSAGVQVVSQRDVMLAHAAKHSASRSMDDCVRVARSIHAADDARQLEMIKVLIESQNVRPEDVPVSLRDWALELVDQKLERIDDDQTVLGWSTSDGVNWPMESRRLQAGGSTELVSSFGRGETYTGRWLSDPFSAPDQIRFWLAGHNGFPDQPDHGKNRVRLLRAGDGNVLRETTPPRNDTAKPVLWDTRSFAGQLVRIECIDGDAATAYAWLAIGGFEPAWLAPTDHAEHLSDALALIQRLGLREKEADLEKRLNGGKLAESPRLDVARTLARLRDQKAEETVLRFCQITAAPSDLVEAAIAASVSADADELLNVTKLLLKRLSLDQQIEFATSWVKRGADVGFLLDLTERGWLSPIVLVSGDAAQALTTRITSDQESIIASLTAKLNVDEAQNELLKRLQASVTLEQADLDRGQQLYKQHCANCHQLRGQGLVVGPQLDGASTRSVKRLLEDIITPDRNVDHAFRTTSFLLDDGRVITGLITSESEQEIALVEPNGKSVRIDVSEIEQRRDAGRSLMPGNLASGLNPKDLGDLILFVKGR